MVAVLAATDVMNLDKLAETADRIADYSAPTAVAAVSNPSTPSSSSLEARHARLEERLDEIVDTLAAIALYCCIQIRQLGADARALLRAEVTV
ncbi:hypothetical protein HPB47_003781 [Ixodes persulcatus]|uniref:Uncharacterized protein n=1 Tax=Ixodes persulcatus TaxID=34615 RepID=A0AC60PHM1_IXOPE|nr:hypothetical protein HPB47_003781 [Ixodes persulcatus]